MLLIDKHKLKQKCNNFGYLSTKSWLKGNDIAHGLLSLDASWTLKGWETLGYIKF